MRRNRMRSFTIDAENEEDFIQQYENSKSRLSKMNFQSKEIKENMQEDEEDELSHQKKKKMSFHVNDIGEDDYSDLGAVHNDEDEDLFGYENDDILKDGEDAIMEKQNNEEKGIEILVTFLKNTVIEESKNMNIKGNTLIFSKSKNIMSLSGNAIYDLNMRELIENILAEKDNEYIKSNEGNNNSLRDYIFQNIESDSTLKIMVMSNNTNTKNSFMNKFFGVKTDEENEDSDEPFEIRKKQIKLFNKTITIQIFDTSDEFHQNSNLLSATYYKSVSAFFIFIECTNKNAEKYLDSIIQKINKYIIIRQW